MLKTTRTVITLASIVIAYRGVQAQSSRTVPASSRDVKLDVDASTLSDVPALVVSTRSGQFVVLEPARLPTVFSPQGTFIGTLGRKGKGPGELTLPSWVDSDFDDSIRVVDIDRIVVFDRALRPVRTIMGRGRSIIWHGALLRRDAYASQSKIQDPGDLTRPVPIIVQSDSGRVLSTIEVPKINAQKTFIAMGRRLNDGHSFWLAEWTTLNLAGYRVSVVAENGRRLRTVSQERAWWIESDFKANKSAAVSSVRAIRQMDDRHIAVLIAQPRPGWEKMPVDPRTMEGHQLRFQTVVETIEMPSGRLVHSVTLDGYPISLPGGLRVATYQEANDGTPSVSIVDLRNRR